MVAPVLKKAERLALHTLPENEAETLKILLLKLFQNISASFANID
jgi:hypothetical protein